MTADQSLLIAQLKRHPMPALSLAHLLGWPLESVYVELVALEAQNKARVVVTYSNSVVLHKEWEAK
jgi:hypothetical protein